MDASKKVFNVFAGKKKRQQQQQHGDGGRVVGAPAPSPSTSPAPSPRLSLFKSFRGFASASSAHGGDIDSIQLRLYASTWNVAGRTPDAAAVTADAIIPSPDAEPYDVYVLGFQEVVPLNAGNVVHEHHAPPARWLTMIATALNTPAPAPSITGRRAAAVVGRGFRRKGCNCGPSPPASLLGRSSLCCTAAEKYSSSSEEEEEEGDDIGEKYILVVCKQMVGIFIAVWARRELSRHVGHVQLRRVGRGALSYLGNKGSIAVSMSIHRTTFCFICSHLAAGDRDADEHRRNLDVADLLKSFRFRHRCSNSGRPLPEKILNHERIIWIGDMNYRLAMSYEEAAALLEAGEMGKLLEKDQLTVEREGGVLKGWKEGDIAFPPTYKYAVNSDSYAAALPSSSSAAAGAVKKRWTPAWCDRILWRGEGIKQVYYTRGESRFSDHRPVHAAFAVEVCGDGAGDARVGAEEVFDRRRGQE